MLRETERWFTMSHRRRNSCVSTWLYLYAVYECMYVYKVWGKNKFKVLHYEVLTNLSNPFLPRSAMGPFALLTRVDLMSLHLPSLPLSHTIILTRWPLLRPFLHLRVLQGPAQVPCLSQALPDKPSLGSFSPFSMLFQSLSLTHPKNPNNREENRSSLRNIPVDHLLSLTTGCLLESLCLNPSAKGEVLYGRDCVFTHL